MQSNDLNQLIQELMSVQKRLSPKGSHKGPFFVLARLVHGMDTKAWTELCAKTKHSDWCALEVKSNPPTVAVAQLAVDTNNTLTDNLLTSNFMKQLEKEVARAVRSNAPLCVVRFSIAKNKESLNQDHIEILQKAIEQHTNLCDLLGGINDDQFGLILPGAKVFKAQNMVEDIISFCSKDGLLLKAGIAGGIGKDCNGPELFMQAEKALIEASEHSANIFKNPKIDLDATLVHSHEKRFLFGGS